jgi:dTMP kinase
MGNKGVYITFEGAEGVGKTTQIKLLAEYLKEQGREVVITREPGGTELAEQLRNIVKYYNGDEPMCDETEALLFAASRAQHTVNLIIPSLEQGKVVLSDRFFDSTIAYQGYAREQDIDFLKTIIDYTTRSVKPDLTLLLDLPLKISDERVEKRADALAAVDRLENEGDKFMTKVREGFLEIAKLEPNRVKIVDASANIEEVHSQILGILKDVIS